MTIITDVFISPLSMLKILWIFSIYIEAIAILPQLVQLYRYKETENLSMLYVFFLGIYRGLFVLNWYWYLLYMIFTYGMVWYDIYLLIYSLSRIHRIYYDRYFDHVGWVEYTCGSIQTILYVVFFTLYVKM